MRGRSIAGTTARVLVFPIHIPGVHGQPYKATTEVDTGENVAILGITQALLLAGSYFTPNNKDGRFWLSMGSARRNSTASYQNAMAL